MINPKLLMSSFWIYWPRESGAHKALGKKPRWTETLGGFVEQCCWFRPKDGYPKTLSKTCSEPCLQPAKQTVKSQRGKLAAFALPPWRI